MTSEDPLLAAKEAGFAAAAEVRKQQKPHAIAIRVLACAVTLMSVAFVVLSVIVISTRSAQTASDQARTACQASILKNIAAQGDINAKVSQDYRDYLDAVNKQKAIESNAVNQIVTGTTRAIVEDGLAKFQQALAEEVRLSQEYVQKSQKGADDKKGVPVVFRC